MSITAYGLQDIKKELNHLHDKQITELCLRMARYKKENKELLAYLLFEADDEQGFIEKVKSEADAMFALLPSQSYGQAKGLRKILRLLSKYIKFMGSKEAEISLLLHFCHNYLAHADRRTGYKPLRQILLRQIEKIRKSIDKLHEDLQFDYTQEFDALVEQASEKLSWFNKRDYLL